MVETAQEGREKEKWDAWGHLAWYRRMKFISELTYQWLREHRHVNLRMIDLHRNLTMNSSVRSVNVGGLFVDVSCDDFGTWMTKSSSESDGKKVKARTIFSPGNSRVRAWKKMKMDVCMCPQRLFPRFYSCLPSSLQHKKRHVTIVILNPMALAKYPSRHTQCVNGEQQIDGGKIQSRVCSRMLWIFFYKKAFSQYLLPVRPLDAVSSPNKDGRPD